MVCSRGTAVDGAAEALNTLRCRCIAILFMTKTDISAQLLDAISAQLVGEGLAIAAADLFSPIQGAVRLLVKRPRRRCLFLVNADVLPAFAGFESAPDETDTIIMRDIRQEFTFDVLNHAFRRLRAGAELVLLQKNPYWLASDGPTLDCGAFGAALEYARAKQRWSWASATPPSSTSRWRSLNVPKAHVGDDVTTDIQGALGVGLTRVLPRTGKFTEAALDRAAGVSAVLDSFADVPSLDSRPNDGGPCGDAMIRSGENSSANSVPTGSKSGHAGYLTLFTETNSRQGMYSIASLKNLVATEADVDLNQLTEEAVLVDLGVNSLALLRILVKLEKEAEIQLSVEDFAASKLSTLSDLAVLVERAGQVRGNA